MNTSRQITPFALAALVISGCAAQKPVLSSNAHLMSVGSSVAEQDIDQCITYAKAGSEAGQANKETRTTPIADAATTSVVGAAAGGAGGAIVGNAGQGAAVCWCGWKPHICSLAGTIVST